MCINMISLRGGKLKMSMFFMCVLMMYKLYPAPTANCLMRNNKKKKPTDIYCLLI